MTISINLNSSGVVYSWDNGVVDGNSFTPSSTNTYTVTATGPDGCFSTNNVTISIIIESNGIKKLYDIIFDVL